MSSGIPALPTFLTKTNFLRPGLMKGLRWLKMEVQQAGLLKLIWEHKNKLVEGFTEKYGVDKLVYYEPFRDAEYALKREQTEKI